VLDLFASVADWTLPDWFAVVGFPLGVLGLVAAWRQLRGTRSAAEAAQTATERTEQHLADNHLLLLIPRLVQASRDLEQAVRNDERDTAVTLIASWRDVAVQVRTLVEAQAGGRSDLRALIDRAIALIPPAEDALSDTGTDAKTGTHHARDRIRDAVDEANKIVTERMAFVGRKTGTNG
jgi:hypothetical protein